MIKLKNLFYSVFLGESKNPIKESVNTAYRKIVNSWLNEEVDGIIRGPALLCSHEGDKASLFVFFASTDVGKITELHFYIMQKAKELNNRT